MYKKEASKQLSHNNLMTHAFLFLTLIALIFFISRKLINTVYSLFFIVSKSKKGSLYLLSFLVLPGTIIHELSHFLAASILLVKTGHLNIFPKIEKSGEVKAGYLEIGKCDPFRYTIIGIAPVIIGLMIIYIVGNILFPELFSVLSTSEESWLLFVQPDTIRGVLRANFPMFFVACYMFFAISSTMFSSRKDLQATIVVGPVLILLIIAFYASPISVEFEKDFSVQFIELIKNLNFYLLITATINYIIFILASIMLILLKRLRKS